MASPPTTMGAIYNDSLTLSIASYKDGKFTLILKF